MVICAAVGASEKIIAIGACEESEETLLSGGHRILMSLADFLARELASTLRRITFHTLLKFLRK